MTARDQFRQVQASCGLPLEQQDGIPGSQSDAAYQRLRAAAVEEWRAVTLPRPVVPGPKAAVPEPVGTGLIHNAWPLEKDAASVFGYPPNLTQVEPPYPMRMFYDNTWHKISQITCNMKVAASLRRILAAILEHYGTLEAIQKVGMDVYDGCYNDRSVRGSSTKRSMHAYGAAIDFDSEHNPLGATTGRMPKEVVAMFDAEGWRWGGRYNGRKDWMHFEACR